ncbi:MAG: SDR family NAD(P)-dependent oxidoreductase [Pseudorhodobacter sp.]
MEHDKVAIVTGGGTGIGKAISLWLAANGYAVAVNGQQKANLDETVTQIGVDRAIAIPADISRRSEGRTADPQDHGQYRQYILGFGNGRGLGHVWL